MSSTVIADQYNVVNYLGTLFWHTECKGAMAVLAQAVKVDFGSARPIYRPKIRDDDRFYS